MGSNFSSCHAINLVYLRMVGCGVWIAFYMDLLSRVNESHVYT
jgi:hypothetical protein